jgi:hypothetical protein
VLGPAWGAVEYWGADAATDAVPSMMAMESTNFVLVNIVVPSLDLPSRSQGWIEGRNFYSQNA